MVKVLADDPDDDDDDRDEDEAPHRRRSKKGGSGRQRKKAGSSLVLWLSLGGVVAVVVVLVIVLGGKKGGDKPVDKPGNPAPVAKEGGGSDAYTVARRIDTNIPLPQREPFILIRGILGLGASADADVIAATSALSPRQYIINRATGKVINEFDDADAKPDLHGANANPAYAWQAPVVSPNGKFVIVRLIHRHNTFKIRDVATGNVVKVLGGDQITHVGKVEFSPNGDMLYALVHAKSENVLAGWRVADWQQVCAIKIPDNREPTSLVPLADGKTVVTITRPSLPRKAQVDFFDIREQKFIRAFVLASWKDTRIIAVSPDGKMLAVVGDNGDFNKALEVYNMDTSKHICTVAESKDVSQPGRMPQDSFPQVWGLHFLPGDKLAVIADNYVATHDTKTGAQKSIWTHDNEIGGRKITHLSLCANGEILLVLDGDTATILVARLKE